MLVAMRIPSGNLLASLRRRRYGVVATLLPALLLSFATGSSCLAMSMNLGAAESPAHAEHSHAAPMANMGGHDAAVAPVPAHPPAGPACPHCRMADQPTAASHFACGAADVAAPPSAFAKHASADAQPLLAAGWVPLPTTPAPPLIRAATISRGIIAPLVPLHIRHCALLI
jgi:hypothetical protein